MIEIPESIVSKIRRRSLTGFNDGSDSATTMNYIAECSFFHGLTGTIILFTRDQYHHTSGWMKNPDYERCQHVSVSFREPQPNWAFDRLANPRTLAALGAVIPPAPFVLKEAMVWVEKILWPDAALSWMEMPFSPQGKELSVRHWRLFCDEAWKPIHPRGEVYSTEFTELGWRSWSELNEPMPSYVNAD